MSLGEIVLIEKYNGTYKAKNKIQGNEANYI